MQSCSAFSDCFSSMLALAMGEIHLAVSHIFSTNKLLNLSVSYRQAEMRYKKVLYTVICRKPDINLFPVRT